MKVRPRDFKFFTNPEQQINNNAPTNNVHKFFPDGVPFEELSKHNKPEDAWISINHRVYDITNYIARHPGGKIITKGLGKEATNLYNKYHSWVNAEYVLKDCFIGRLRLI